MPARANDLFGHPRGLTFLFATEMWERFSYYGMRALLVLYMVKYLLQPEHAESVIGLGALKQLYESMFGPLGVQPFSSHIYGLYTGLVYLTPVFGGILADRVLGQHRTILLGAALMAIGHFMMAFEPLFLLALTTLILGNGAFKPNMSAQVGALYAPGDPRRDRAYSIFYVGINLGAFLAPLVCGTLGEELGWHYGFTAAGVGMTIALAIYLYAMPRLPPDELQKARAAGVEKKPLDRNEWRARPRAGRAVRADHLVLGDLRAAGQHHRAVGRRLYRPLRSISSSGEGEIPVTWFQAFNPFMIFAFTPFVIALWAWQAKRGAEPSTVTKMSIGCFGVALANLIMVGAAWQSAAGRSASWLWLLGYFVVITIGELYLSPIGLSLVSKVAPARMVSMLMGLWLATSFIGNFIAGWLGSFWSSMDKIDVLPDDRRHRHGRRRGHPGLRPSAQERDRGLRRHAMSSPSRPAPRAFGHVETWVFDLDNTLYPHHVNLWQQVDERIRDYIAGFLKITHEEAFRLQKDYYKRYGTSMRGLMTVHGMKPDDFLDFVHQIDHSPLEPNAALGAAIERLPGRKLILTNGTRRHADAVLARLELDRHFEDVFDIVAAELEPKPSPQTYDRFLKAHGVDAGKAAMFEDLARNLAVPHALGMTTVLVVPEHTREVFREGWELEGRDAPHVDHVTDDLVGFLERVLEARLEQQ